MERRLAAILAADVVGYSRLMGQDETGTLDALKSLHKELVAPEIAGSNGRVVKLMGDGLLAEFGSVVDAVECAVKIQTGVGERNGGRDPERQIRLRIGINLGDVIVEGRDIFGDGVNVAARLEGLADPGGICISDMVYQSVKAKLDHAFEDLGPQDVKNIAEPVHAFRINLGMPQDVALSRQAECTQPSQKPSIAVLPFNNMSGDPEQEYFADGITEDIITELSKFRWLTVIARNSSFTFKGQSADVRDVGQTLGVRYVLEGSIRRAGERVRITGQLIDATDGSHIWAEKFDGVLSDIFELQDKVCLDVISAIEPSLRQAEIDRLRKKPTDDLQAYELYLRAQSHFHLLTDEDNQEAIRLLSMAIDKDPGYAIATGLLAWCLVQRAVQNWELEESGPQRAISLAKQVMKSDRADAMALAYAGHVFVMFAGDHVRARGAFERSLSDNPNSALAHALCALNCAAMMELDQALSHADQALRLSPNDTFRYSFHLARGMALLFLERYEEAAEAATASVLDRGSFLLSRYILVAALALKGDLTAARTAADELRTLSPAVTVGLICDTAPVFRSEAAESLRQGLLQSGIPE